MAGDATQTFGESQNGLPVELALLLEQACDRFEARSRAGERPDLAAAVRDLPEAIRAAALSELVQLDAYYRRGSGHALAVGDYAGPFPQLDPHWLAGVVGGSASPDPNALTTSVAGPRAAAGVAFVGKRFAGFEVIGEIARGAMGVVFRARQAKPERVVALKVIRAGEFADPGEVRRFRQEAEAAATLDHPNIVSIYEVGECRGVQFYAMRLVEGGSLAVRMAAWTVARAATRAEARVRQRKAGELMATAARAVNHAHQRFILHRDLKPGNILLDESGAPHVADFGLARRIGKDSTLTRTGAILGTPSYMAPEQARGRGDVTTGADVYGLGAVLYELLAGRPPFVGEDVLDTLYQVREREPVGPRSVCAWVDRDLETVCLKCLEKDPNRRYASAAALADDLDRWRTGEPILARRAGGLERAVKWARRNPAGAGLVALGLLLAAAVVWTGVAQSYNAELVAGKEKLESANAELTLEKSEAERLRGVAEAERARAAKQEALAHRYLYVTQMNQAQKAYEEKGFGHALALLEKVRPERPEQEDLRGPEWHHLWRLCGGSVIDLRGHPAAITALAYSADGALLASGDAGGGVKLWDVDTQRERHTFAAGTEAVNALAFDPAGRRVAAACDDRLVRVWDVESGRELARFDGHRDAVLSLAFHPTADRVISGGRDGSVDLWDVTTGLRIAELLAGGEPVLSVAATSDGNSWAAAPRDGAIRVWEVATATESSRWGSFKTSPGFSCSCLAFSPDGSSVLIGKVGTATSKATAAVRLELRSVPANTLIRQWQTEAEPVIGACFNGDGKTIATITSAGNVSIRSRNNEGDIGKFAAALAAVASGVSIPGLTARAAGELHRFQEPSLGTLCLAPNGRTLVTGGRDRAIRIRPLRDEVKVIADRDLRNVAFSADGRWVTAGGLGAIHEVRTGHKFVSHLLKAPGGPYYSDRARVRFSRNSQYLSNGEEVFDIWGGGLTDVPLKAMQRSYDVDFAPERQQLALTAGDSAKLIDLTSMSVALVLQRTDPVPIGRQAGRSDHVATSVRFSPDGSTLAVGYGVSNLNGVFSGEVQLWDVRTGKRLRTLDCRYFSVMSVDFSSDGQYLAAACGNPNGSANSGEVIVWDVRTGREVAFIGGFECCVWGVSFSPDGTRLAAASGNLRGPVPPSTVRIWDLVADQEVASFRCATALLGVSYTRDGRRLGLAGQKNFGVEIWGPP